jgi:DNA replication protein DnaC
MMTNTLKQHAQKLEALKAGFVVLYRSIFDLVRELLSKETLAGEARLLNKYLKPDLLIID